MRLLLSIVLIFLIVIFSFCNSKKQSKETHTEQSLPTPGVRYVNLVDTLLNLSIGHGFYQNNQGEIFERKTSKETGPDSVYVCDYLDSSLIINEAGLRSRLKKYLDIKSYEEFPTPPFSRDRKHVYYFHLTEYGGDRYLVRYADPKSFEHMNGPWAKDRYHVFYWSEIIKGADPSTFRAFSWDSAADRKHTYMYGSRVD